PSPPPSPPPPSPPPPSPRPPSPAPPLTPGIKRPPPSPRPKPPSALPPPSPPPPFPPPQPFPPTVVTHDCVISNANVPYAPSALFLTDTVDQQNYPAVAMCTTISAQKCRKAAFCCSMDLAKMEVPVNNACKSDLRRITINGIGVSYSWGLYTSNVTTLKFEDLSVDLPNPDGATLCWVVRPGACSTPSAFCQTGYCQVALFSSNNKCCPSSYI
ncbi:hypothetical protein Agub_g7134, partial [Astrephomene gubernaculifera]